MIQKRQWIIHLLGIALLLMTTAIQAQDTSATAISVRGVVTATNSAGDIRRLKRGDPVFTGDRLRTARRAQLRISFTDGATTVLKANTIFEITGYNFSGQEDGTERASFNLVRGAIIRSFIGSDW